MGLIILTGVLSVMPHDDFLTDHSHAGTASSELASTMPSDDTSEIPDERSVIHCNGAAHLFTSACAQQYVAATLDGGAYFLDEKFPLAVTTAPATPPPIL